jgi:hypothetical protein
VANKHPGNCRLRNQTESCKHSYRDLPNHQKAGFAGSILRQWRRETTPPGRFLEKCEDAWIEVPEIRAIRTIQVQLMRPDTNYSSFTAPNQDAPPIPGEGKLSTAPPAELSTEKPNPNGGVALYCTSMTHVPPPLERAEPCLEPPATALVVQDETRTQSLAAAHLESSRKPYAELPYQTSRESLTKAAPGGTATQLITLPENHRAELPGERQIENYADPSDDFSMGTSSSFRATAASLNSYTKTIRDQQKRRGEYQNMGTRLFGKANGVGDSYVSTGMTGRTSAAPGPTIHIPPRGIGSVYSPERNDVLCGRGGRVQSHSGNVQFHDLVQLRKVDYLSDKTKKLEKAHIAASIVRQIREMEPPGRFLKEDPDGSWYDIGKFPIVCIIPLLGNQRQTIQLSLAFHPSFHQATKRRLRRSGRPCGRTRRTISGTSSKAATTTSPSPACPLCPCRQLRRRRWVLPCRPAGEGRPVSDRAVATPTWSRRW